MKINALNKTIFLFKFEISSVFIISTTLYIFFLFHSLIMHVYFSAFVNFNQIKWVKKDTLNFFVHFCFSYIGNKGHVENIALCEMLFYTNIYIYWYIYHSLICFGVSSRSECASPQQERIYIRHRNRGGADRCQLQLLVQTRHLGSSAQVWQRTLCHHAL